MITKVEALQRLKQSPYWRRVKFYDSPKRLSRLASRFWSVLARKSGS